MKNFLSAVFENTGPFSIKLLFSSFMAGYLLATLLFFFSGPRFIIFLIQLFRDYEFVYRHAQFHPKRQKKIYRSF